MPPVGATSGLAGSFLRKCFAREAVIGFEDLKGTP